MQNPQPGTYFHDGNALYHVESVINDTCIVEICAPPSFDLQHVQIASEDLRRLIPVRSRGKLKPFHRKTDLRKPGT